MNILRQRTTDIEVKKYCVSLLEKTGSFKYTLDVLEELDELEKFHNSFIRTHSHTFYKVSSFSINWKNAKKKWGMNFLGNMVYIW